MVGPWWTLLMAAMASQPVAAEIGQSARAATVSTQDRAALDNLVAYVRGQNTTGFLVIQDGEVLIEQNWAAPATPQFALFAYERSASGALFEDVASQQKSFVAVLVAIAVDKGLIDIGKPVSDYVGTGWSRASAEQEAQIRVVDLLTMRSGLDDRFGYVAPVGTRFHYNTPVYAVTKRVLAAAAGLPLETLTHDWLTGPAGMNETAWRKRPAALASVGNDTGLVTTPRDIARLGQMILNNGLSKGGVRIVSEESLKAMFAPSATNPAYGQLWWLNGSAYTVRAAAGRIEGPLVPAAPADMVGAFGAFDRRLYIVPSRKLVVVRTGAAALDRDFDQQLWLRLMKLVE